MLPGYAADLVSTWRAGTTVGVGWPLVVLVAAVVVARRRAAGDPAARDVPRGEVRLSPAMSPEVVISASPRRTRCTCSCGRA